MLRITLFLFLITQSSYSASLYNVNGCPKYKGLTRTEFSLEAAMDQIYSWVEIIEMDLEGALVEKVDNIENIIAHTGNNLEAIACRMKKRPSQTDFLDFKEVKELTFRYEDLVEEVDSMESEKSNGLIAFSKAKLRSVKNLIKSIKPKKEFIVNGVHFDSRDFNKPVEIQLESGALLRGIIVDINTVYGRVVVVPVHEEDSEKGMLALFIPIEDIQTTKKI